MIYGRARAAGLDPHTGLEDLIFKHFAPARTAETIPLGSDLQPLLDDIDGRKSERAPDTSGGNSKTISAPAEFYERARGCYEGTGWANGVATFRMMIANAVHYGVIRRDEFLRSTYAAGFPTGFCDELREQEARGNEPGPVVDQWGLTQLPDNEMAFNQAALPLLVELLEKRITRAEMVRRVREAADKHAVSDRIGWAAMMGWKPDKPWTGTADDEVMWQW